MNSISTRLAHLCQLLYTPQKLGLLVACVIGIISALSAAIFQWGVGFVGTGRVHLAVQFPNLIILPLFGAIGGFISGWLVERFAPESAGSGIPQVKAAIANVAQPLNLRIAGIKLIAGIMALGSGLALGREGPTVQVGASLALTLGKQFRHARFLRKQIVAAGAGAGLAAAFNAPMTGVLFIIEELLKDVSRPTLGMAIVASFVGGVVSRLIGNRQLNLDVTELARITSDTLFSSSDLPFFILIGILAGLLSALFNHSILASLNFYDTKLNLRLPLKVALAGLISGIIFAILPDIFMNKSGLQELLGTGQEDLNTALLAFVGYFILTVIAYGSGAPGGLFAPCLILGAALGCIIGILAQFTVGSVVLTTYALVGMGAFFSGAIRVPITAIAIIAEMNLDLNLILPLMISSVTAYLVGEAISPGSLYDRLLERSGIHLKHPEAKIQKVLTQLWAVDVMQKDVALLTSSMTIDQATQFILNSPYHSFPVLENDKLLSLLTLEDLQVLTQNKRDKVNSETLLKEVVSHRPVTINPDTPLLDILSLLNQNDIEALPVVEQDRVIGIVTYKDILRTCYQQED
ncbi:MAG: chloride channel protein [Limnoraphis sp.]